MTLQSMKRFWVYIIASRKNGTLYTGVTSGLARRAWEHRQGAVDGFSSRHRVKRLVYYEEHPTAEAAIQREKNIKHWSRQWKIQLIESTNPAWNDLYLQLNR
jgi:putative endonuclease